MRRRDQLAAWAVIATLLFSIMAIGGAARPLALIAALLGVASALPYLASRRSLAEQPPLLALIAVAVGATLFQLLPLPLDIVAFLAPGKAQLIRDNAAALGEAAPGWTALSLEPSGGWLALAQLIGYLGAGYAAIRVATTAEGRLLFARSLVIVGASLAVIAAVHEVAGATKLFGLYAPQNLRVAPSFLAPLINPNHLAMVLACATPIAIALAFAAKGTPRLSWAALAAVSAAVLLLLRSRTGTVALIVGIVVLAVLLAPHRRFSQRKRTGDRANTVAMAIVLITLVGGGLFYFGRGAVSEIAATEGDEIAAEKGKLSVWKSSTKLIWEHKLTGVGRGAFEQAFTPRVHDSPLRYSHVENEVLQTVIDWGIPIALLMFGLLVASARVAIVRAPRSAIEAGLFAGLVAAALHHLADFAIELSGPAMFVLIAFATLSRVELAPAAPRFRISPRVARAASLAVALTLIGLAASGLGRGPRADAEALDSAKGNEARKERALANWRMHPADYMTAGQVADEFRRSRDDRAFRVASRALALNPTHWQLHLAVARMLLLTDRPTQAIAEYRLAAEHARDMSPVVTELVTMFPRTELAVRGLPRIENRLVAVSIALRVAKAPPAIGAAFFEEMTEAFPLSANAFDQRARFALATSDWRAAAIAGKKAVGLGKRASAVLAARALLNSKNAGDAAAFLDGLRADPSAPAATRQQSLVELPVLAKARRALGNHALAAAALEEAIALVGTETLGAADLFSELADIQDEMGHLHQAKASREAAERLNSGRPKNN